MLNNINFVCIMNFCEDFFLLPLGKALLCNQFMYIPMGWSSVIIKDKTNSQLLFLMLLSTLSTAQGGVFPDLACYDMMSRERCLITFCARVHQCDACENLEAPKYDDWLAGLMKNSIIFQVSCSRIVSYMCVCVRVLVYVHTYIHMTLQGLLQNCYRHKH